MKQLPPEEPTATPQTMAVKGVYQTRWYFCRGKCGIMNGRTSIPTRVQPYNNYPHPQPRNPLHWPGDISNFAKFFRRAIELIPHSHWPLEQSNWKSCGNRCEQERDVRNALFWSVSILALALSLSRYRTSQPNWINELLFGLSATHPDKLIRLNLVFAHPFGVRWENQIPHP